MTSEPGCRVPFSLTEIRRFLGADTFRAWDDLRTQNEVMLVIQQGSLPGLIVCCVCRIYAAIPEQPLGRLFYCRREGCRAVTCRNCNIREHHGKSCEGSQSFQGEKLI